MLDDNESVCGILTQTDIIQILARNTDSKPRDEPLGIFQRMPLGLYLGDDFSRCKELLETISWRSPVIHAFCTPDQSISSFANALCLMLRHDVREECSLHRCSR